MLAKYVFGAEKASPSSGVSSGSPPDLLSPPSSCSQTPLDPASSPVDPLGEDSGEDTWSSWAWSVGSALLPIYWEEDGEEEGPGRSETEAKMIYKMKRTIELGLYVDTATWVFKVRTSAGVDTGRRCKAGSVRNVCHVGDTHE